MSEIPLPSSLAALINWSSEAWTNALEAVSKAFFSRCHHSRACPSRMTCCAEIQSPKWVGYCARRERPGHHTTNRFNEIALPHVTLHSGAAENYLKDTTSGYGGVEYHRVS